MKKFLLLTVLAAFLSCSLAGCGFTSAHLNRGEELGGEYAYVTGSYYGPTDILNLGWEDASSFPEFAMANYSSVVLRDNAEYKVQKVNPGLYGIYHIDVPYNRYVNRKDGKPFATVYLEAGKITYLGDIGVSFAGGIPGSMATSASPIIRTADNSQAAKKAILKNHPELAGKLDSVFVFKLVQ